MVLEKNIPEESGETGREVLKRLPNYCVTCGGELVIAGGHINPREGYYPHLDTEVVCSKDACVRYYHTAGVDGEEGREFREIGGSWGDEFDGLTTWCDIHREAMEPTKDLLVDGSPGRQFKCESCDRESVVKLED